MSFPKLLQNRDLDFTLKGNWTLSFRIITNYDAEKDYFYSGVHANPLLHLWSLGVENSFTFLFSHPLGIKVFKTHLSHSGLYTVFSFMLACQLLTRTPNSHSTSRSVDSGWLSEDWLLTSMWTQINNLCRSQDWQPSWSLLGPSTIKVCFQVSGL